jgi:hypothetical protein
MRARAELLVDANAAGQEVFSFNLCRAQWIWYAPTPLGCLMRACAERLVLYAS